jgi:hypothetical protein
LGEIITEYVFGLLESAPVNLVRKELDNGIPDQKPFVYVSHNFGQTGCPDLAVLIHGSGVVRAGQWARRLIINDNLDLGTMIPEILELKSRGFEILITNTNDNYRYSFIRTAE